jgi:hypothetical protein
LVRQLERKNWINLDQFYRRTVPCILTRLENLVGQNLLRMLLLRCGQLLNVGMTRICHRRSELGLRGLPVGYQILLRCPHSGNARICQMRERGLHLILSRRCPGQALNLGRGFYVVVDFGR